MLTQSLHLLHQMLEFLVKSVNLMILPINYTLHLISFPLVFLPDLLDFELRGLA